MQLKRPNPQTQLMQSCHVGPAEHHSLVKVLQSMLLLLLPLLPPRPRLLQPLPALVSARTLDLPARENQDHLLQLLQWR